jgi:hypothetical protein
MGSNVCGPLSAAGDFGQQRVSRKWFGDHRICLYHRVSHRLGLAAKHDHRDVRRGGGRPEFGQHGQAGPLWQNQIQQHQRQGFTVGKPQSGETI